MTGLRKSRPGISLVELVVAVALLSVVSLAAIQLLNMTERTMIGSQTKLNDQLRSESIASYIYKDFARGELDDAIVSRTYTNDSMPDDLRGGGGTARFLVRHGRRWSSLPDGHGTGWRFCRPHTV